MEKQEIETWVPAKCIKKDGSVLDFTGLYEVSDMGRVRSLNYRRTGKTKVLSSSMYRDKNKYIYYMVWLCLNNKRHLLLVHRLVLSSFKEGEYFSGAVCDHIDARTKSYCNDHLDNLHWVTQQDNVNTDHCKALSIERRRNRLDQSKRVRVTDLTTGESTEFSSAKEAGRSLGINPKLPSACINQHNGYYKKRQLYFEYVN